MFCSRCFVFRCHYSPRYSISAFQVGIYYIYKGDTYTNLFWLDWRALGLNGLNKFDIEILSEHELMLTMINMVRNSFHLLSPAAEDQPRSLICMRSGARRVISSANKR